MAAKETRKGDGKPAGSSSPRARVPKTLTGRIGVEPAVKRARIFHIAKLMAAGEWSDAVEAELVLEWGLKPVTVRNMAAEASRICDYCTNDRAKLVSISRVRLAQIASEDAPDRVQAIRTQFEHLGELKKRVEMSGPDGHPIQVGVTAKVVVLPAEEPEDEDRVPE